jgi:1,4-dihydroxy-2-naphthoate octaprenyltransferase
MAADEDSTGARATAGVAAMSDAGGQTSMERRSGVAPRRMSWTRALVGFYRPATAERRPPGVVTRFVYAARGLILVITAQAALIAGVLAAQDREFNGWAFARLLIGLLSAHLLSNLSNDFFDLRRGRDTPDSPRVRYSVHPFASDILSRRALAIGIAVVALTGIAAMLSFIVERGWLAAGFALGGIALLFLYDAAPVPLKSIGLGEPAVFVVWGPLMIGGGYAMITGHIDADAMYASVPYGLSVTTILLGKHFDKIDFDRAHGIYTLPALIGAHASRVVVPLAVILVYGAIAALIVTRHLTPFAAVSVFAIPQAVAAIGVLRRPRPAAPPPGHTGWPLWYCRACARHNRWFGWAYLAGLAAGAIWPEFGRA